VLDDPYVSGHHIEAWVRGGALYVRDLGSRNGTFLNGEPFAEGVVPSNATLRLGRQALLPASELLLRLSAGSEQSMFFRRQKELDYLLVGSGLGRRVGKGTVILREVDVTVRSGQFIAIAGASGAGKSTLMKVLNGYTPPDTGRVLVAAGAEGATEIGYVPQDDIISRELALRDAIVLSGRLRYPPGTSTETIEARADEVLAELGLSESSGTVVGRLSGGQRKRASVALELMRKPRLLLLDEPTSGLDPASDRRLIRLLRALADTGIGILLITHTTANIAACDTVAFLAPGGYLVFWGHPDAAKRYFAIESLEEAYEKLESEGTPAAWRKRFLESGEFTQLRNEERSGLDRLQAQLKQKREATRQSRAIFKWQLAALTQRYARTLLADRRNLALLLLQIPAILMLARVIFAPDVLVRVNRSLSADDVHHLAAISNGHSPVLGNATPGIDLLFVIATTLVWLGTINAAREICKELPIWERERHVGVSPVPYLLSKILVLGALCVVQTVLLLALMLLFWDVPGGVGAVLGILLTGFLASLSGVAIGLSISASVSSPDRAVALVPIIMIPQILFGGTIIPLSGIGAAGQAISAIVGARWTFEALARVTDRMSYLPSENPFGGAINGPAAVPIIALLALVLLFGGLVLLMVAGWSSIRGLFTLLKRRSIA
jgi:ABC transport system ATP-binding/permease protein